MSVNFYLDKRPSKKGDHPIRVSISIGGSRIITSAGYGISPDKWDERKQRVRNGTSNSKKIRASTINSFLMKVESYFLELEAERPDHPDINGLWAMKFGRKCKKGKTGFVVTSGTFYHHFDRFLIEHSRKYNLADSTIKMFINAKVNLRLWRKDLEINRFGVREFNDFISYLQDKGLAPSTQKIIIGKVKTFLRWCFENGLTKEQVFDKVNPRIKDEDKQVIFLTIDEIKKLVNLEIPKGPTKVILKEWNGDEYVKNIGQNESYEVCRDLFCFCCFTGLRFSDAYALRKDAISSGKVSLTTIKTKTRVSIELNEITRAIVEKYKDSNAPDGKLFPSYCISTAEHAAKELCELAGINQPITKTIIRGRQSIVITRPKFEYIGTHTARRSFICNALSIGITPHVVMKWTGHSSYDSMRPYIDITDTAKEEAMVLYEKSITRIAKK